VSNPAVSFPRRGEVYWLNFAPATGQEMTATHPCVIVQNDIGNEHSALTIVVAVTSNLRAAALPVGVLLRSGEGGLSRDSVAHCGHVYTVDKKRLGRRIGRLSSTCLADVDRALARSIGLIPS
jgi:mRNA interferase MazF